MVNLLRFIPGKQRETAVRAVDAEIVDLMILGSARVFGDRYGREISESSNLYYAHRGRPGQVVVSLTWETLAQLRQEAYRHGHFISDPELIDAVVMHWGPEQLEHTFARGEEPPAEGYVLAFRGPNSSGPREVLERAGLI